MVEGEEYELGVVVELGRSLNRVDEMSSRRGLRLEETVSFVWGARFSPIPNGCGARSAHFVSDGQIEGAACWR